MNDQTATQSLEILLNNYVQQVESFEIFKDYDQSMAETRAQFQVKIQEASEPVKPVAEALFEISDQTHFLFQVIRWKIFYIADGLLHAIKAKNPVSLANNARALLEHIATIAGVGHQIGKLIRALEGQSSHKKIKDSIQQAQTFLERSYYGRSPTGDGDIKSIHINNSLRSLERDVQGIGEHYGYLCEFVHPNYGSNQLVSSGELASGQLNPPEDYQREVLDQIRRICSYCMIYLQDQAMSYLVSPLSLSNLVELCLVPGAKVESIFSKKSARPIGDGRSKETAYFFPKARTSGEAITLTYEFFENEGYQPQKKEVGGIEEECIFDIHHTNKGKVWVKIPLKI
jgi:hypothetical protein